MTRLSTFSVRALASEAAHNVTASGSVGGEAHNVRTIEIAILRALAMQRGCTYENALEQALLKPKPVKRKKRKKHG